MACGSLRTDSLTELPPRRESNLLLCIGRFPMSWPSMNHSTLGGGSPEIIDDKKGEIRIKRVKKDIYEDSDRDS